MIECAKECEPPCSPDEPVELVEFVSFAVESQDTTPFASKVLPAWTK